jgi:hypothetical protein
VDLLGNLGDNIAESLGCKGSTLCQQTQKLKEAVDSKSACLEQADAALSYVDKNQSAVEKAVTDYSAVEKWEDAGEGSCSAYNGARMLTCITQFTTVYNTISECEGLTETQKTKLTTLKGWNDALGAAAQKQGLKSGK